MLLRSIVLLALSIEVAARGGRGRDDPNTETMREGGDGQDNDGDGTADCDDPDCATAPPCMAGGGRGGRGGCAPWPRLLSIGAALTRPSPLPFGDRAVAAQLGRPVRIGTAPIP